MIRAGVLVVMIGATAVHADEAAFRAAGQLAAQNDPRALAAFEAAGTARPVDAWTDDAWVEAARIAELQRDYDRARRDLAQAIAVSTDPQLVRRAKANLARLAAVTGDAGEWTAVSAEHQRLATGIADGGDPAAELVLLERLASAHPAYPRGVALRIAIARAWETEDEVARGLRWLRDAIALGDDADRARIELVRMLIRHRMLGAARAELALVAEPSTRMQLARSLAANEAWQRLAYVAIAILFATGALAAYLLHRRSGGVRAALRRLARPPIEVLYFLPVAIVVGAFAATGSPLVAKAVIVLVASAAMVAWVSGATLEAARRRGVVSRRHAVGHAAVVGVAMLAAVYLALDHARVLDLVAETWRTGPSR